MKRVLESVIYRLAKSIWESDEYKPIDFSSGTDAFVSFDDLPDHDKDIYFTYAKAAYREMLAVDAEREAA